MVVPGAGRDPQEGSQVWTIVVAGGAGVRFGSRKQFVEIDGVSVLQRSVVGAAGVSEGVVIVVPDDAVDSHGVATPVNTQLVAVAGGSSRAESVRAGLAAVPDQCDIVLVHDAARPLATARLFSRIVDAIEAGAEAVVPGVEVSDSMRLRSGGAVDRDTLVAVQTPQGFRTAALRKAHQGGGEASDDATLVERTGGTVVVIDGELANRKITDPIDLAAAEAVSKQG
jgi:2-C-methyl-D-erythritol 4-phosphate cytidylyltransferase